jgi:hypothetical protein
MGDNAPTGVWSLELDSKAYPVIRCWKVVRTTFYTLTRAGFLQ